MPIKNVTTAGAAVALVSAAASGARVTLQRRSTNTGKIYIGFPGPQNTGSSVSSSVYDAYLDSSCPSVTVGMGETGGDTFPVHGIYLDADTNGEGVAFFVEEI